MARLHVGTSGWVYKHWKRIFYPDTLPARSWFEYFSNVFSTVELNTTFYRLPKPESVDRWRDESPRGFLFAAKGSRYITHMKRLTDPKPALAKYFEVVGRLRSKLGPILWQLPPQMNKVDLPRLENFLEHLPKAHRSVFEFRADAWHTDEVCDLLDAHGVAFCEHDLVKTPVPRPTGGFRYLRFHGATGKYQGRYGTAALRPFARDLDKWHAQGHDAFVYFNNDIGGHALSDAMDLSLLLGAELPLDLAARPG
jgi:uncharacterized protein YecE (DUF72 family)